MDVVSSDSSTSSTTLSDNSSSDLEWCNTDILQDAQGPHNSEDRETLEDEEVESEDKVHILNFIVPNSQMQIVMVVAMPMAPTVPPATNTTPTTTPPIVGAPNPLATAPTTTQALKEKCGR